MTNAIEIYQTETQSIEVKLDLDSDTLWLTQRQMAEVFDKDIRTINEHLKNIYEEQELMEDRTIRNFRIVQKEGQREVARELDHDKLDAILSVGYRLNSKKGTQFRMLGDTNAYSKEARTMTKPVEIYTSDNGELELKVALDKETVWLAQDQLCALFGRERSVITKHINNVFKEAELERGSVCAKFARTADDGKTYQTQHYNLDVIISVGYRVKSPQGVKFRQ